VDQTNVNRYSLYHEFDNKHGMLYEALKLYKERYADDRLNLLNKTSNIQATLQAFFESYLTQKNRPPGCFIIYIATELGDTDTTINAYLKTYLAEVSSRFLAVLNTEESYKTTTSEVVDNLTLLFCNAMCHCHIQEEQESKDLIALNLELILNQKNG
jgi:AcrR family transcriptional regulator